jgi:ferredoxin
MVSPAELDADLLGLARKAVAACPVLALTLQKH